MIARPLQFLATIVASVLLLIGSDFALATPLDDYVHRPDSNFSWFDTGKRVSGPGWKGYILNMTSQAWLTPADWSFGNNVGGGLWWHYMLVVIPDKLDPARTQYGFIYSTGGENDPDKLPTGNSEDALVLATICVHTGVVGTALFQIPNQPIFFAAEKPHPKRRIEDGMIAWTWQHFIEHPDEPEWLARLPMTKAMVRGMDTLAAFVKEFVGNDVEQFIIAGASKRGWTTWTTGAVDKRIKAMVPLVMDELNFVKNIHHHYRAYGGWSFALNDYYELNFTSHIDDPVVQQMFDIIDPYVYRDRYTFPKMVVDAGGDEFFLPDDEIYWWKDMTSPKYFLEVQNAEHSLATGILEVLPAITAFANGVLDGSPMPSFNWTVSSDGSSITVFNDPNFGEPEIVKMYVADSAAGTGRRDFRLLAGAPKPHLQLVFWKGIVLQEDPQGNKWVASVKIPSKGWRAFFIHLKYPGPPSPVNGHRIPYQFTTYTSIVPQTFPYPECHLQGCRGVLV
jgi:PhoPQ-activated pathogenicity-related protein